MLPLRGRSQSAGGGKELDVPLQLGTCCTTIETCCQSGPAGSRALPPPLRRKSPIYRCESLADALKRKHRIERSIRTTSPAREWPAGVKDNHRLQDLRSTYISAALNDWHLPIQDVAELVGHRNLAQTRAYLKVDMAKLERMANSVR